MVNDAVFVLLGLDVWSRVLEGMFTYEYVYTMRKTLCILENKSNGALV